MITLIIAHIEELGNEPLLKVIRELGGWPVLGAKSGWSPEAAKSFNWLDLLIKFRQMGFSHDVLIDLSVTPDFRNNTKHVIDVSLLCIFIPISESVGGDFSNRSHCAVCNLINYVFFFKETNILIISISVPTNYINTLY